MVTARTVRGNYVYSENSIFRESKRSKFNKKKKKKRKYISSYYAVTVYIYDNASVSVLMLNFFAVFVRYGNEIFETAKKLTGGFY